MDKSLLRMIWNGVSNAFIYACYGIYTFFKYVLIYPSYYLYHFFKNIVLLVFKIFQKKDKDLVNDDLSKNLELLNNKKKTETIIDNSNSKKSNKNNNISDYYINPKVDLKNKTLAEKINDRLEKRVSALKLKKNNTSKMLRAQKLIEQTKILEENNDVRKDKKVTWKYEAITPEGKKVIGYFDAYTKSDIMTFLMSEELVVYKLMTNKWIQTFYSSKSVKPRRIRNKHLIFIITQLSTYLKSGIPLADAIGILVKQTKDKNRKRIFRNVRYDLLFGESLSAAMEHQGKAFPPILINMIKSAELTGELPEVLDDMANYFTDIEETRKQMVSALTYPTMVLVFTIAVIVFVMIYVVPKFIEIYDTMDSVEIPAFTKAVINISFFLEKYIIWILLGFILIVLILWYLYTKVKVIRTAFQYLLMKFPILGNIIIYNEVAIFSKTFASLLKHNVFITDSMDILMKVSNNEIYHSMILETIQNLSKGEKISSAFKNQWAFPIPAYEMIVTGEKTGQLAEMMDKVSSYYQDLHRNSVTRVKALLEPIVIILLTFGVGAVLLAVVIPMFNMYEVVQSLE